MFSALTEEDQGDLDARRARIAALVRTRYRLSLKRTTSDLRLLQKLLDDRATHGALMRADLRNLGVCFGDVLTSLSDLRWVIVDDEHGRDPTLRWNETSVQINAMTMILKRVLMQEPVDLAALGDVCRSLVEAADGPGGRDLARMRLQPVQLLVEGIIDAAEDFHGKGGGDVREAEDLLGAEERESGE